MACPKSVRTAAIVSQSILILWAALQLLSSIFQKSLIFYLYIRDESTLDAVGKVLSWSAIAFCVGDLLFTAANLLMCMGKGRYAPIVISAVTVGLLPVAGRYLSLRQNQLTAFIGGADKLAVISSYNVMVSLLSYLLYAAAIITIAAAAVYAYSKKTETAENVISAEITTEEENYLS